jgi:2-keto-4-pentenoate hydratase
VTPPPVWTDPRLGDAVARQMADRTALLDAGHRRLGWKVGLGAPAAKERLGIRDGVIGYLTSATLLEDGAEVSLDGWTKPALEPELAIHLGADVPARAGRDEAEAAIIGLGPAVELADVDAPPDDLARIVAGNVYHARVMLGPVDRRFAGGSTEGITVEVTNRGELVGATREPTALTGELVDLVLLTAGWLGAAGETLLAGDVIIAGSTLPLVFVAPGDDIHYACPPVGTLRVRFTG